MTVEELESLADSMGYYLVKKPERKVKLIPCTCGAKQIHTRRWRRLRRMACGKCGRTTEWFTDPHMSIPEIEKMAREAWNDGKAWPHSGGDIHIVVGGEYHDRIKEARTVNRET